MDYQCRKLAQDAEQDASNVCEEQDDFNRLKSFNRRGSCQLKGGVGAYEDGWPADQHNTDRLEDLRGPLANKVKLTGGSPLSSAREWQKTWASCDDLLQPVDHHDRRDECKQHTQREPQAEDNHLRHPQSFSPSAGGWGRASVSLFSRVCKSGMDGTGSPIAASGLVLSPTTWLGP